MGRADERRSEIAEFWSTHGVLGLLGVAATVLGIAATWFLATNQSSNPGPPAAPGSTTAGTAPPAAPAATGHAVIGVVRATDGDDGIDSDVNVPVTVDQPPPAVHRLWLVARTQPVGTRPGLYYARTTVPTATGTYDLELTLDGEGADDCRQVGSVRTLMIVSADPDAHAKLEENRDRDQGLPTDPAYNAQRRELPAGARIVSNQVEVRRTRC